MYKTKIIAVVQRRHIIHAENLGHAEEFVVTSALNRMLTMIAAHRFTSGQEAFEQLTEMLALLLSLSRCSIWLFDHEQSTLCCRDLYLRREDAHTHGTLFSRGMYPGYFQVIDHNEVILVDVGTQDRPALQDLGCWEVAPGALLCMPIEHKNKVIGVFRCEIDTMDHQWRRLNLYTVQQAAALVGAVIEQEERASISQQYEALWVNTNIGMAIIQKGRFLMLNKALAELAGVPAEELIGRKVTDFIHTEDASSVLANHDGTRTELVESDCRIIRADGTERIAKISTSRFDLNGTRALQATIVDKTDEIRATNERIAAELKHQEIINKTGTALILINQDTTMSFANEKFIKISGYSKEELEGGMSWIEFVHPDDIQKMREYHALRRLDPSKAPGSYLFRLKTKDGEYKTCLNTVTVLPDGKSSSASMIDITDQIKAEEKYAALVKNSPDVIMSFLPDLTISYCNAPIKEYTGVSPSKVVGKRPDELRFPKELTEKWQAELEKVFRTKKISDFEMQLANGRWIYARMIPVFENNGTINETMVIAQDITNKKTKEEYQLRERKLDALSILAGGIGHDFNNILTAIGGNLSLSLMDLEDIARPEGLTKERIYTTLGNIRDMLNAAKEATYRGGELTRQLMQFAKEGSLAKTTSSLPELLKKSAEFFTGGTNISCQYVFADDTWPVDVDPQKIAQVFDNLVLNAKQAMSAGGVITICTENILVSGGKGEYDPLEKGPYVKVSVTDQGHGISPDMLKNIFVPYFTTKKQGQGLGLANCYSVIRKHNGTITVSSEEGKGATFSILLPASPGKEIVLSSQDALTYMKDFGCGKVLVMEDDDLVSPYIIKLLQRFGYDTVLTKDGEQAVHAFREAMEKNEPFVGVILDLTVPGKMGGKQALELIKTYDRNITSFLVSGNIKDEQEGFTAFLHKPFTSEDFGTLCMEHLPLRSSGDKTKDGPSEA